MSTGSGAGVGRRAARIPAGLAEGPECHDTPDPVRSAAVEARFQCVWQRADRDAGNLALVVLDDARDAEQLADLLPNSRDCLAVVTSRRRMTALRTSAGADLVSVSLPDREEARTLLLEHLGGRPGGTAPVLDALIDECGRLPLALAIAGAHARASAD